MEDKEYNGWTNYETWNVALYIQNIYGYYCAAQTIAQIVDADQYRHFLDYYIVNEAGTTSDGVAWNDPKINVQEINEMIKEL